MTIQIRTTSALFAGVLLMLTALPGTAFAVDGQIAITQAKAMAGGVTPGDAAGFPVTISQPGSYVLSGNLTVPDANTTAIVIDADHVTIDLNGFAILGPTDCSGGFPCGVNALGRGITTDGIQFNITIRNGTIQGMGEFGIFVSGDSHLVEYVHVRSNSGFGIFIQSSADQGSSIVQNSTAERNGFGGILIRSGTVTHNVVDVNSGAGISIENGSASYNVLQGNQFGLVLGLGTSYIGNTMYNNMTNVSGGHNLGQNLAGPSVCPGAQF